MAARKQEKTGRRPSRSTRKEKPKGARRSVRDTTQNDFPIVAIGASAGGLKALEGFFDQMPSDSGMAFVVVQHLDPKHESLMTGLLEKHTRMKVSQAGDRVKVEQNKVYVKAPGRDLIIDKRTLHLVGLKGTS
ncbi:MAG TPA: chemotaxis protein CheB, partial [Syntrophobacteria bacterium]|nr:chemotaxis protein CheB [Syntrophobacteria bacterium]